MNKPTRLAFGLTIPLFLSIPATDVAAQGGEAAAIKAFKKDFKPKAKALEISSRAKTLPIDSPEVEDENIRRKELTDRWRAATRRLKGFSSPAVAKLIAANWVKIDKEVAPLWVRHAKLERRVQKEYQRAIKANGGEPPKSGQPVPRKARSAYSLWLTGSRRCSEVRLDITELTSLQDELRLVVEAMDAPPGLTWFLTNVVGDKKYSLLLKVAAIRATGKLGSAMIPNLEASLAKARAPDVIAALVFGLGILGEKAKSSAPKLIELLQHEDSGVREQAALALQHMKIPESIEPLITLVAREGGQAKRRIVAVLEILTGQQHGTSVSAWQAWFAKEGADYAAGKKTLGLGMPSDTAAYNKKNYYYGIPQIGKGIVYVIDCSGSMVVDKDNPQWRDPSQSRRPVEAKNKKNSRSEASKQELIRALRSLSGDQRFNIVWYNHSAALFKKTMVSATPKNKAAANKFIKRLPADSSTNIYDAMKLAFTLTGRGSYDKYYGVEFDTIFLLTDGKPTLQGLGDDDPKKIIEGVRKWNALKRVVVHTIAMGDKGIDHDFMGKLAEENGGQYRKIIKGGEVVDGNKKAEKGKGKKQPK